VRYVGWERLRWSARELWRNPGLRSHIDHSANRRVFCLQTGTIHRRRWQSWKAHEDIEELVMATVQMGEYMQTMGREAATVVFAEVIVIAIAIW
jgi:hypothetical protein